MSAVHRIVLGFISVTAAVSAAQPDAKEILTESLKNYDRSWRAVMRWSYTETDTTTTDGKKEVDVSQVIPLDGTPYEKLISKDGRALTPDEKRREDEKYDRELRKREHETPGERRARIEKYEKEHLFLRDVPNAYNVRLIGEEMVNGRPAWVLELTPREGFVPTTPHASLLKHIKGKLWVDKHDMQWAKAEADVIDTAAIGVILARIGQGSHVTLDFHRVSDTLWVPKQISVKGAARVLLVHTKNLNEDLTFSDYHLPDKSGPQVANAPKGELARPR